VINDGPAGYEIATAVSHRASETVLDKVLTNTTDVWALSCLPFEIHAGFPLFNLCSSNAAPILTPMIQVLVKLPGPWWTWFKDRAKYFKENAIPKKLEDRTSIRALLRRIGVHDSPPHWVLEGGPNVEPFRIYLSEEVIDLFEDLLSKML
jgi:serine/threonine-protein kinase SRPK3